MLPLVELCQDIDPSFSELNEAAELLTPFATEFRYPGDILNPDPADAEEAFQQAKHTLMFVEIKLRIDEDQQYERWR